MWYTGGMEPKNVVYGLVCRCPKCEEEQAGRIRYVGQTVVGLKQRMANHRTPASVNDTHPVSAWKREHGVENIEGVVLEVFESSDPLPSAETKWATRLETYYGESEWGLNGCTGKGESRRTAGGQIRDARERARRGEDAPNCFVTDQMVRDLRAAYKRGENIKELSKEMGVKFRYALDIIHNYHRHDPNYTYVKRPARYGDNHGSVKVSEAEAWKIWRERRDTGASYKELGEKYGVSHQTVGAICTGRRKGIPHVKEVPL